MTRGVKGSGAAAAEKMLPVSVQPKTILSHTSWWQELDDSEQQVVQNESVGLAQSLLDHGYSKLAIGEHLTRLRDVLEPKNLFVRFLGTFHFSVRSAYRYINGYANAKASLPESVLKIAMSRNYNILGEDPQKPLGVYTEAAKQLPPPQKATPVQAAQYLDKLEEERKKSRSKATRSAGAAPSGDDLLRAAFQGVAAKYKRLPEEPAVRQAWVRRLVDMVLNIETMMGVVVPMPAKTAPAQQPGRRKRGRPRQQQQAQAA